MLKKINELLKFKKYCKYCIYWIKYIEAFNGYHYRSDKEPDDGMNICRKSLIYIKNEIGETKLKTHNDTQVCEYCDQVIHEKKQIIFDKCEDKNREFKCKDFKAKWYVRIFMKEV